MVIILLIVPTPITCTDTVSNITIASDLSIANNVSDTVNIRTSIVSADIISESGDNIILENSSDILVIEGD